jgi:hypothetical protein
MRKGFVCQAMPVLAAALLLAGVASAQEPMPLPSGLKLEPRPTVRADFVDAVEMPKSVIQAQCSNCGGLPPNELLPMGSSDGCGGNCVAGGHCKRCEEEGGLAGLYCRFYNAFQCPDPCYEPSWVAGANASLFVDSARPKTGMRFRWDNGRNVVLPDRSEYFWAKIGGKGPKKPETNVDYNDLSVYIETGAERFSAYTIMPYRSVQGDVNGGGAGFGATVIGSKTLLIDTEYAQLTLQFGTYLPLGSAAKGTGVGHLSLEPGLILAARLTADTYFQGQINEWIPIGGDPEASGAVFNYGASLNHIITRAFVDSEFIATLEARGWCFQDGTFTDPATGLAKPSAGGHYFSVGPGFRWVMSDKCDFGFGVQFAVTKEHFANQLYRSEFRLRF